MLDDQVDNGADQDLEGISLRAGCSSFFVTTALAAPDVELSDKAFSTQISSHLGFGGPHANGVSQSFMPHFTETAPSILRRQLCDELTALNPPLYFAMRMLPAPMSEKEGLRGMGLRYYHLNTMTAILHRCLWECDYIRAGRAWAILLRAEQNGHSVDLRTHDRWGIGAEIITQRDFQIARKALDLKVVETSNPMSNLHFKLESFEKAKEYYERLVLQYPHRKASPDFKGALRFSIAMFSLWVYAVKEQNSRALMAVSSFNKSFEKTVANADENVKRSSASPTEPDRYWKFEQVRRHTLQSAHAIADRLSEELASPPYSENETLWKLCREISLWTGDLSVCLVLPNYGLNVSRDA